MLSFDPIKDPLASVLLIPLFAVRCGQFHELIEMEQELAHRNVESMPNWCLAIALAYIYLDQLGLAQQRVEECLKRFPGLLLKVLTAIQGIEYHFSSSINMNIQPSLVQKLRQVHFSTATKDNQEGSCMI